MRLGRAVAAIGGMVMGMTVFAPGFAPGQTLSRYRCADGAEFAVAFYERDPRAFLQVDGQMLILRRWPSLGGRRYSGGGVVLRFTGGGITIKRGRLPASACAAM